MHSSLKKDHILNKNLILTKAVQRMADELGFSQRELSLIMGRSEATFSRLFNHDTHHKKDKVHYLDSSSKEGQIAILLLRIYKNLDALFGGNVKQSQLWLRSENTHLHAKPIDLIKSVEGIVTVVQYLDAMRGKN